MKRRKDAWKMITRRWLARILAVLMICSVIPLDKVRVYAEEIPVAQESTDVNRRDFDDEEFETEDSSEDVDESQNDDLEEQQTDPEEENVEGYSSENSVEETTSENEELESIPDENITNDKEEEAEKNIESDNIVESGEKEETSDEEEVQSEIPILKSSSEVQLEEDETLETEDDMSLESADLLNDEGYTVILNANGGIFSNGNDTLTLKSEYDGYFYFSSYYTPSDAGKEFLGWSDTSDSSSIIYNEYDEYYLSENIALYAIWRQNYTVTLDANGGVFSNQKGIVNWSMSGENIILELDQYIPTSDDYTFIGWSEHSTASEVIYEKDSTVEPSKDMTLYAIWKKNIMITLDAKGGKIGSVEKKIVSISIGSPSEQEIKLGDYKPVRSGYHLQGWALSAGGVAEHSPENHVKVTEDITLYAVWIKNFTVTLDGNGGLFGKNKICNIKFDALTYTPATANSYWTYGGVQNHSISLGKYTPTRKNYRIAGWSTTKSGKIEYNVNYYMPVTKDVTLYAVWAKDITLTLKSNGGLFPKETRSNGVTTLSSDRKTVIIKVAQGTEVYLYWDSKPTKANSALRGWSSDKNAAEIDDGSSETLNVKAISNKTYYAVWTTSCKVTLKATGNLRFQSEGKYVSILKVDVPKGSTLYTYQPQIYVALKSGNKTNYKTIYEAYGTNGKGSDSIKWGNSATTKPKNAFFGSNYKVTKDITLYAINSFTVKIKWDANGGKIDGKKSVTKTKAYAADVYSFGVPVYAGRAFLGWSTTKKASGIIDFNNPVYALKNTTYYSIWEKAYKISIKGNGGLFTYSREGTISKDKKTLTVYLNKGKSLDSISFTCMKGGTKRLNSYSTTSDGKNVIKPYQYYPTSSMTLYMTSSVNEGKKVSITYKANGGKFYDGGTTVTESVLKGRGIYHSAIRDGYAFTGWFTKSKGGTEVILATKKMTVYAHWKKQYKVIWKANGGSLSKEWNNESETSEFDKNEIIGIRYSNKVAYSPANDKGFIGWSTSRAGKVINLNSFKVKTDMSLYAVWGTGDDIADGRIEISNKRYVYKGKPIKPKVTIYDRNGSKVSSSQYTIQFDGNDSPGTAYIIVHGRGKKSGILRTKFNIYYDERSDVKSAKVTGKNVKVFYSKAKWSSHYRVYAVNKKTGDYRSAFSKTTNTTITKLTKGTYDVYVLPVANDVHETDGGPGKMSTITIK
ncbi:MAG: InlB B-repeat-containing protein [Lachnospiraceae bacterium]|nr:InlB B-repeat-containing protein [Lachnospiraceae bacterium]